MYTSCRKHYQIVCMSDYMKEFWLHQKTDQKVRGGPMVSHSTQFYMGTMTRVLKGGVLNPISQPKFCPNPISQPIFSQIPVPAVKRW